MSVVTQKNQHGEPAGVSESDYRQVIDDLNVKTPRIESLRRLFYDSTVRICPQRSHLATESWKKTEGEPLHLRRAKLFARICDGIDISIFDHELIVGSQTPYFRGVGLQLDFNPLVGLELEGGDRRLRAVQTEGTLSDEDLNTIIEDSRYWKGKSPGEITLKTIGEQLGTVYDDVSYAFMKSYGSFTNFAPDADYEKLMRVGLKGIIAEIGDEIKALEFTSPADGRKYQFLQAAKICCEAEIRLAKRYAQRARNMVASEPNELRKKELNTIADVCDYVPENPPRTFWEALQTVRFIHLGLYLEDGSGAGASLDRVDQYLYPIYKADIEEGRLSREEASELIAAFWVKIAATDRIPPGLVKVSGAGYVQSRAILGGVDREGKDACNELTYFILHVAGEMNMDLPLYLRWHSGISRDVMLKAVWTNTQVGSEPAFHNDEQIIPGLVADGASLEDARDYVLRGCSHPYPYGSVYGTVHQFFNGAKVFELVMYNGYDPTSGKEIGMKTGDPRAFTSLQDWLDAFQKQWEYVCDILIRAFNLGELTQMQLYSQPFVSALTADCIKKGLDVHEGGSRYNQFASDVMNKIYGDITDSLAAINELVYKQQKLTIDELINACANNFAGEKGEQVRQMLVGAPKFGNDTGDPEEIYRHLNDGAAAFNSSRKGYFGFPRRDTRVGGAVHMAQGQSVGALPSGRKAGMPLADGGISPCAGCDTGGPTVTLRSVARALDFTTNRSAVLNQKMPVSLLRTREQMSRLVDLVETYFADYNGYQLQWNMQDRDVYVAAKEDPTKYKDLIVRVGGFSAYFIELDPLLQDQIIARTEQGFTN
jgi:pyruvate formate-lyase/glycerol dehydratase family glycyl radical enzyme